jgi:hypothetical protein
VTCRRHIYPKKVINNEKKMSGVVSMVIGKFTGYESISVYEVFGVN